MRMSIVAARFDVPSCSAPGGWLNDGTVRSKRSWIGLPFGSRTASSAMRVSDPLNAVAKYCAGASAS